MLSRRSVLAGGAAAALAGLAGAAGVHQGVLPGRPWVQERLGLNGEDGVVPDVAPGPVERGSFVSRRRGPTGWAVVRPAGAAATPAVLPLVVALHGLGADHATLLGPAFGLPEFLTDHVARGGAPFAVAAADGGRSYWHPRPDGEDAGAMVTEELLPLLAERGLPTDRIGLLGWSMGGYGALRLGGLLGADRVAGIAAVSPALWTDPDDASPAGFADAAEYSAYSVMDRHHELADIPVRLDCGTGDPFHRAAKEYAEGFPADAGVRAVFEAGGHDTGYWRRMLPAQLTFLGRSLQT
ncbi:alpha/beta hydrolase-fold protein [Nocardioides pantholopis]|uniref:alpha/beta hydrolase-fold protein n=1 Tax=Nocardioides pantholopis TaxID=2483798 RepID=UPI001F1525F6|nr:alpha/beta hydrolase-fold protein [Nocardioides pantholopis]